MLKFAAIKDLLPTLWPALCSIVGMVLLAGAWPLSEVQPFLYTDTKFIAALFLWFFMPLLFFGLAVRPLVPAWLAIQFVGVFSLVGACVLAYKNGEYRNVAAQCLSMAGLMLVVLGLPAWGWVHRWLAYISRWTYAFERISAASFTYVLATLFLASAIAISWYCFDFSPGYTDSTAQFVHGKFVASGHLYYIHGHKLPDFFPVWMMVHNAERWYSQYPPMHQTLLGFGHWVGAPWLINPLEGMLTLLTVYAASKRAYGIHTARIAAILVWFSPFILFMSGEFMNHSSSLLFATLLIYTYGELQAALENGQRSPIRNWALAAGLSWGGIFLSRPLTCLGVSLPFALHALWQLKKDYRKDLASCLFMGAAAAFCIGLQLWYNKQTTDEWLTYAYTRYHNNSLGSAMGYSPDGDLFNTLGKMREEWYLLDIDLFEWSLPCIFFVVLCALAPAKNLMTRLLLGMLVSQTVVNLFNQFHNTVFGPRYMFEIATALVMLTAAGISQLPQRLKSMSAKLESQETAHGMAAIVMLLICAPALVGRVPQKVRDYTHFMDSHPQFYHDTIEKTQHPALVFMSRTPANELPSADPVATFRWTAWTNPPDPDAPVIYAIDRGDDHNRALMAYYSNRKAYIEIKGKLWAIEGPPVTPAAP